MSPVASRRLGLRGLRFDAEGAERRAGEWRQIVVQSHNVSIPDLTTFRIDFEAWLATLDGRDRAIIAALISGERAGDVAHCFALSAGRVSQLRRGYERRWRVPRGDTS
jgi:hypothetical protein